MTQSVSDSSAGAELWTVDLDGKNERKITELKPMLLISYFYNASGERLIWVRYEQGDEEIWMMTGITGPDPSQLRR